jgi:dCMP deaminase
MKSFLLSPRNEMHRLSLSDSASERGNLSDAQADCTKLEMNQLRTYGWTYRNGLSADVNYMDLASLLSRNSKCFGGHMGCVLVKKTENAGCSSIVAMAINTPLFSSNSSDAHAEVNAIASCARRGISTAGSTAYITMPPCINCFILLQAAGVSRIVTRHPCKVVRIVDVAAEQGIELASVPDDPESEARRAALVAATVAGDGGMERARVEEERRERKEARKRLSTRRQARDGGEGEDDGPASPPAPLGEKAGKGERDLQA